MTKIWKKNKLLHNVPQETFFILLIPNDIQYYQMSRQKSCISPHICSCSIRYSCDHVLWSNLYNSLDILKYSVFKKSDLCFRCRHKSQMFFQRFSRLARAAVTAAVSAAVGHASLSRDRISHRFTTDDTPMPCFSMSFCNSYKHVKFRSILYTNANKRWQTEQRPNRTNDKELWRNNDQKWVLARIRNGSGLDTY